MAPRGKSRSDAQDSESVDPAAGLLPAGLRDVLAPRAEWEAQASEKLLAGFARHGYRPVKPPRLQFEETLPAAPRIALAGHTFRGMHPSHHPTMGPPHPPH